jgi:acyl-coenzyme A thioesterase 9
MFSLGSMAGETIFHGTAHFVMVGLDRKTLRGSDKVSGLLTSDDSASSSTTTNNDNLALVNILQTGKQRSERRKQRVAVSLEEKPPLPDEMLLVHSLFKQQQKLASTSLSSSLNDRSMSSSTSSYILRHNSSLSHSYVWMEETQFESSQFMHMQERNIHGKVFGGFIMRTAFELAWVTAAGLVGSDNTCFLYVHEIQFVQPVTVGSLVDFTSRVIYSEDNYIVIHVDAKIVQPITRQRTTTNLFSYVFQ